MKNISLAISMGVFILSSATFGSQPSDLIGYEDNDVAAIRNVAISAYQGKKVEGHITDIYNKANTKRLAQACRISNFLVIGYEDINWGGTLSRWFVGKTIDAGAFGASGEVFRDYAQCVLDTQDNLHDFLRSQAGSDDIVFTGYKSGASIASIAAISTSSYLNSVAAERNRNRIKLMTFCSEPPGDKIFAREYKRSIPLYDALSFVHHDNFPFKRSFCETGGIGIPIRISPEESWKDISNKGHVIAAQCTTVLIGGAATVVGGAVIGALTAPITVGTAYKLPAWMGAEPYGAPSEETVKKAFHESSDRSKTLMQAERIELIGMR